MIPAPFGYTRVRSVDEALAALAADDGAKLIAGGQSLLPLMKLRLAQPASLVDISGIGELKGVSTLPDGRLAVGALTTYAELYDTPAFHYGTVQDALPTIGDVQVRNLGTVGGSLAHADPVSDLPAVMLSLGAEVVLRSSRGERTVPLDGFFEGPFQTGLGADELLVRVILPAPLPGSAGSAFQSLEQKASGYSMVGVSAVVIRPPGGPVQWAGVGVTGVSEVPYRAREVEDAMVGTDGSADVLARAAELAVSGRPVNSDIHAGRDYRAAMAAVVTRRALEAAVARIG